MQNKIILLVGMLCILNFTSLAQSDDLSSIIGNVTNEEGLPQPAVSVFLKNTSYKTKTGDGGEFSFVNLPAGAYIVRIEALGFIISEKEIVVTTKDTQVVNFLLTPDIKRISEVAVLGKSDAQRNAEQAFNVSVIDAKKLYNTSSDINQVLNRTTGIRIRETGGMGSGFNFLLNGFSGNQIKFFLDGVPMDNFGSSLTLNNIPINMADRIEVYKGVVPVGLGSDALGGAVNIVTNQGIRRYADLTYTLGSFNTHRASFNGRYTSDKGFLVNAGGYLNHSDNNYKINVSIADTLTGVFGPKQSFPHFHDAYRSAMVNLEAGLVGKGYADRLLIGAILSGNHSEIQQGSNMQYVVGEAFMKSTSFIPTLKYTLKDKLLTGLSLQFSGSYNITTNSSVDTSSQVYSWDGSARPRRYGSNQRRGELGDKMVYDFEGKDLLTNSNLEYAWKGNHTVTLNHTMSDYSREENDLYRPQRPGLTSPAIQKHTLGIGYKIDLLQGKFSATSFLKRFAIQSNMVVGDTVNLASSRDQIGYGAALTYYIFPNFQLKASYEHAYRMPNADEMLGDGLNVISNPFLSPETSDNINVGASFYKVGRTHQWGVEASGIYRDAANFIRINANGPKSNYENMASVGVRGVDGAFRYGFKDWFLFEVNATYQHIINTERYEKHGTAKENFLYKLRVPNIPYFFGNADLTFRIRNFRLPNDNLSIALGNGFVEAFYLRFPTLGDPKYKREIPRQLTQNIAVTYSLFDGKYNLTVDCRNIGNVEVYDYFNVQKPGRTFSAKLRYFIN